MRKELASLPGWLAQDDNPAWAEKHLRRLMEKNPAAEVTANARFSLAAVLKNKDEASQPEAEKLFESIIEGSGKAQQHLAQRAKQELDEMYARDNAPWQIWKKAVAAR